MVRPGLAQGAAIAFVLILPFAMHAVWDAVEARRVKTALDSIARRQEPIGLLDVDPYHVLSSEAAESARYYTAAAALATYDQAQNSRFLERQMNDVQASIADGALSEATLVVMRAIVDDNRDALRLLDHATPLVFESFSAGTDFSYRWSHFQQLARLASMRTALATHGGSGDAAADAFYAELRLRRAIERVASMPTAEMLGRVPDLMRNLARILQEAAPSSVALARIAGELGHADQDDLLKRYLLAARAWLIDATFSWSLGRRYAEAPPRFRLAAPANPSVWVIALRPWYAHQLRRALDELASRIDIANRPWPARIDAAAPFATRTLWPNGARTAYRALPRDLALLRCARVAVAIEQYRRDHGDALPLQAPALVPKYLDSMPVDPFSGQTIQFIADSAGYKVYSVGTNRRDDGGRFDGTELLGRDAAKKLDAAADFGIRIARDPE